VVSIIGVLANLYMIARLLPNYYYSDNISLVTLSLTDLLVCLTVMARRVMVVYLDQESLNTMYPRLLPYLVPIEKGTLVLASLTFMIYAGGRHLKSVEKQQYRCVNTLVFSVCVSCLVMAFSFFELMTTEMTGEEVELEMMESNVTVNMTEMIIEDDNLVNVHTELFSHPTYAQIVRLLFNFVASQISVIFVLPVIFLHTQNLNKIKRKMKMRQDIDRLLPVLSFTIILLCLPYLVNFLAEIALYSPTPIMKRVAILCLTLGSASKIIFYAFLDKSLYKELFCRRNNHHILIPLSSSVVVPRR